MNGCLFILKMGDFGSAFGDFTLAAPPACLIVAWTLREKVYFEVLPLRHPNAPLHYFQSADTIASLLYVLQVLQKGLTPLWHHIKTIIKVLCLRQHRLSFLTSRAKCSCPHLSTKIRPTPTSCQRRTEGLLFGFFQVLTSLLCALAPAYC